MNDMNQRMVKKMIKSKIKINIEYIRPYAFVSV